MEIIILDVELQGRQRDGAPKSEVWLYGFTWIVSSCGSLFRSLEVVIAPPRWLYGPPHNDRIAYEI